ncbi:MAG: divalent-cation tolerance protein CutA [Verrucomicrobia bacterium]|nr:divalent-cation tolerance protein CutA [Verrucomicrobiota bacterium]
MKSGSGNVLVLVTAPTIRVARKIAKAALETRLAACANLIPGIESHYWWQGKLEVGREILIIFKTSVRHAKKLKKVVIENHPYDTPEVVNVPIQGGSKRYLAWLNSNLES